MKTIIIPFLILSTLVNFQALSQGGTWTWVSGSNVHDSPGVFGIKGVSSPSNMPPALYESCEWTDLNGIFWLYGGVGGHNDKWKYNPNSDSSDYNQWTWMQGSAIPATWLPVYGVQGVPSTLNTPGGIGFGAMTWVDKDNYLWLFGGSIPGEHPKNDLWKYDPNPGSPTYNQWTWMKGAGAQDSLTGWLGHFGTPGMSDAANLPPGLSESNAAWTDKYNNLWLYGGLGLWRYSPYLQYTAYDNLWKYSIESNTWTWVSGTNTFEASSVFGTRGVASPGNTPGGRMSYAKFRVNDKLYMYGGALSNSKTIFDTTGNDLWSYDLNSGYWTWHSGTNSRKSYGKSGSFCEYDTSFVPSGKYEQRAAWANGNCGFYVYGGFRAAIIGNKPAYASHNDLFYYDLLTDEWSLMSGISSYLTAPGPSYGTKGSPDKSNNPGGRGGALPFKGSDGSLWLFGGMSMGTDGIYFMLNDLWKFTPDTMCVKICPDDNFPPPVFPPVVMKTDSLFIPNVFSPNSDGKNDFFVIENNGIRKIDCIIYNRWGEMVYTSKGAMGVKWDGTTGGKELSAGVYYYVVETVSATGDSIAINGFLTLVR